ncbi:hypothetical protein [Formosa sp. 4Alg 33]|uniref:hypothetical protein n=1 Tax=Formosa sp. 4Alg 33 TaxID=3382189 RepID=UPI003D9C5E4E
MIDDVNGRFKKDIDLRTESELKNGLNKYSELAEFNFMVGYTISFFTYVFGDNEEFTIIGKGVLKKGLIWNNLIRFTKYVWRRVAYNYWSA